ncbi:MAG TPA: response regulator [Candidatus Eisenbacteria bacterium]|jgi:DNA-binding response OmpR family regulator|nr:response regulator [Candidatus Eisenbacteria bacterium]
MPVPTSAAGGTQLKVVLVEDDKFLQKILMTKFIKEGFDVRSASDAEEGLQLILTEAPNIVLLDLILPKMSGFDLLTELKTNPKTKGIPVVILSNLGQEEDVARAKGLGAIDFLVKADISINEVVQKVKEIYVRHLQGGGK